MICHHLKSHLFSCSGVTRPYGNCSLYFIHPKAPVTVTAIFHIFQYLLPAFEYLPYVCFSLPAGLQKPLFPAAEQLRLFGGADRLFARASVSDRYYRLF
jgi:hypothetical protein